MEGIHTLETVDGQTEKQKAFQEIAEAIAQWRREFETIYFENKEVSHKVGDILYAYAQFIHAKSNALLESTQARGEYRSEQAVAKLHELNIVYIEELRRTAEVFEFYPEIADTLMETYPWFTGTKEWAESLVQREESSLK